MAIALRAGLVAIRKAEKAAWTAKSSSFAPFAILAGAVILGVVMLTALSSMDGSNPV